VVAGDLLAADSERWNRCRCRGLLVVCCLLKGLEVLPMDPDDAGGGTAAFLAVVCCLLKGLEVVAMDPDDAGGENAAFLAVAC